MRINLYQHTRAIKNGEHITRNLDIMDKTKVDLFISNLENWDVGIVFITNHNLFDLNQFNFFEDQLNEKNILLLPGIEINIKDNENNIHNMNILELMKYQKLEKWL
ncbi:hypothetical protein [Spiroplasma chrysopicola]|uniref:PHP domain-containing protein n=1 Tax=Spiroplasma chrysopicola DF-1 TaxID=1276227 RepID=R4U0A0_9MOLU|nr:hypothetical protein [Spiroplasma chrysopicola]AGM24637.1 hypothetical protein SCHRY_v1c00500 [Spiroplasma chrysopicola DF-1]